MALARKRVRDCSPILAETAETGKARADPRQRRRHRLRLLGSSGTGGARKTRHPAGGTSGLAPRRLPVPQKLLLLLLVACVLRHRDRRQQQDSSAFVFGWGASAELRPESDLTSNCLNFPARNFDPASSVKAINGGNSPYLPQSAGADAIDFTLHDLDGNRWNLGETLERTGRPVVMVWGMYTCPAFQGYGDTSPWDECGYRSERDLVESYKDRATFVHMYGPEPHPATPGTNFDEGSVWQMYWSVYPQHRSYQDRLAMAGRISGLLHPDQTLLVDYLPGNPYSELIQPVWCSYAMGARPVTMVTPDGKLFFQRAWFFAGHVAGAIDEYWCEQGQQQQQQSQQEHQGETNGVPSAKSIEAGPGGGQGGSTSSACRTTSDEEDHSDMGEPGIPPLAGVLSRVKTETSSPPWWPENVG
ncbi:unnamed protein product [Scytosiphon promiscuus]